MARRRFEDTEGYPGEVTSSGNTCRISGGRDMGDLCKGEHDGAHIPETPSL